MKAVFLLLAFCLLLVGNEVVGQTSQKLEFDRLQHQYEMAVKQALDPIDKRYVENLQELLKRATVSGDLETANKIKDVLQQKGAVSIYTRLTGTKWTFPVKNTPREQMWVQFEANGVLRCGWNQAARIWKVLEGDKVELQPYSEAKYKFVIDFDGGLRRGTIIVGESKGEKIERAN